MFTCSGLSQYPTYCLFFAAWGGKHILANIVVESNHTNVFAHVYGYIPSYIKFYYKQSSDKYSVNVYANDMSDGTSDYSYLLVVGDFVIFGRNFVINNSPVAIPEDAIEI